LWQYFVSMAQRFHRKRHAVDDAALTALRPLFRYSYSRNAYILRLVGARTGPVLTPKRFTRDSDQGEPAPRPDPRGHDTSRAA
jgi:hypothetical protein